jgi:DNA-binding transcriptional LysR family regulator
MAMFAAVADARSFAAASRRLAISPARMTRTIAALEQHLGARLLHRTTRTLRLTDAGIEYLGQVRRILAEVAEAEAQAAAAQTELAGSLSITAPVLFGRLVVAPIVLEFLKLHARLSVRATFSDAVVDLVERDIDVAVRIGHLADSGLRAVRVGAVDRVVCGSPAYLRTRGAPQHPRELIEHEVISFAGLGEPQAWRFVVDGKAELVQPKPRLVVNSADLAIDAAVAGFGLTKVLSYQVEREIAARKLKIVLAPFQVPSVPVHVVHTAGRNASARLRAFVDFAVERLRTTLR